jgi:hypothetical protein
MIAATPGRCCAPLGKQVTLRDDPCGALHSFIGGRLGVRPSLARQYRLLPLT